MGNGDRLRYFFILLLRPPTKFFSNQLYDKVPREVNSCLPRQNGDYPERGGESIPKYLEYLSLTPLMTPLTRAGEIILLNHDYTYFGAQPRGLHSRYSRHRTPHCWNARGFATDLLARLWLGRTRLPVTGRAHRLGNINEFQNLPSSSPRFGFCLGTRSDLFGSRYSWVYTICLKKTL